MDEKALFEASIPAQFGVGVVFSNAPVEIMAIGAYFGVTVAHINADPIAEARFMQLVRDGARLGREAYARRIARTGT